MLSTWTDWTAQVQTGYASDKTVLTLPLCAQAHFYLLSFCNSSSVPWPMFTTHRIQSPAFISSNPLLMFSRDCWWVTNSSTQRVPFM